MQSGGLGQFRLYCAHTHPPRDRERRRGSSRQQFRYLISYVSPQLQADHHYLKTWGHESVRTRLGLCNFGQMARPLFMRPSLTYDCPSVRPVPVMACCCPRGRADGGHVCPSRPSVRNAERRARQEGFYSFVGKPSFKRQKSGRFFSVGR